MLRAIPASCFADHPSLFSTTPGLLTSPCSSLLSSPAQPKSQSIRNFKKPHLSPKQQLQLSIRDDSTTPSFALYQAKPVLSLESSSFAYSLTQPLFCPPPHPQPIPLLVPVFVCLQGELRTYSDFQDDRHTSIKCTS